MGRKWRWTPTRREALRLRVTGEGVVEVARKMGVHRTTLFRWERSQAWFAELVEILNGKCDRRVVTRRRRLFLAREMTTRLAEKSVAAMNAGEQEEGARLFNLHVAFATIESTLAAS